MGEWTLDSLKVESRRVGRRQMVIKGFFGFQSSGKARQLAT